MNNRKIIPIFCFLLLVLSIVTAGTCTIDLGSGSENYLDYTSGKNVTITCASPSNTSLAFSKGDYIGITNDYSVNATPETTTLYANIVPERDTTALKSGCSNNIDFFCTNDSTNLNSVTQEDASANAIDTCVVNRVCIIDYITSDVDDVTVDIIGSTGVETKNQMPLFMLALLGLAIGTTGLGLYKLLKK